jgi:plastocyanin
VETRFSLSLLLVVVLAVAIGLFAAQSQPKSVAARQPTPAPTAVLSPKPGVVEIIANPHGSNPASVYYPSTLRVKAGLSVAWVNLDTVYHTVTADDGSFNSNVLNPGNININRSQVYIHKFTKPGRFSYSDYLHGGVRGVIIVTK